jgi:hypothetical protein
MNCVSSQGSHLATSFDLQAASQKCIEIRGKPWQIDDHVSKQKLKLAQCTSRRCSLLLSWSLQLLALCCQHSCLCYT